MSKAKKENNKRPNGDGAGPTRSFDSSVTGPGSQIGQFRIERELGRGAVGVVYLAHDTKLDREVAIKSLPAEVMGDPKTRSRFSREARVLASLNHPNIATIHDELEEAEGFVHLVLEYVPGQTLTSKISEFVLYRKKGIVKRSSGNRRITKNGLFQCLMERHSCSLTFRLAQQKGTLTSSSPMNVWP